MRGIAKVGKAHTHMTYGAAYLKEGKAKNAYIQFFLARKLIKELQEECKQEAGLNGERI